MGEGRKTFHVDLYSWDELRNQHPVLLDEMMTDRRIQFCERLGWPLHVNEKGWEQDEYDARESTRYVIATRGSRHLASGRIVPTADRSIVTDHFSHLTGGRPLACSEAWEATRILLSPRQRADLVTVKLILLEIFDIGMRFGLTKGVRNFIAVYDERIKKLYESLGLPHDEILGSDGEISVGRWEASDLNLERIQAKIAELRPRLFTSPCPSG